MKVYSRKQGECIAGFSAQNHNAWQTAKVCFHKPYKCMVVVFPGIVYRFCHTVKTVHLFVRLVERPRKVGV